MTNITALLGSRICHDLINPLGAIGNGMELLELAGTSTGPELSLVSESVENATARVRYLRLAFGDAQANQIVPRRDILNIFDSLARGGRTSYSWDVPNDPNRLDVRTALLSVMCVETALPLGGDIEISLRNKTWSVRAQHERLNLDPKLWVPLTKGEVPEDIAAAQIHFAILPAMAHEANRSLTLDHGTDWVRISF